MATKYFYVAEGPGTGFLALLTLNDIKAQLATGMLQETYYAAEEKDGQSFRDFQRAGGPERWQTLAALIAAQGGFRRRPATINPEVSGIADPPPSRPKPAALTLPEPPTPAPVAPPTVVEKPAAPAAPAPARTVPPQQPARPAPAPAPARTPQRLAVPSSPFLMLGQVAAGLACLAIPLGIAFQHLQPGRAGEMVVVAAGTLAFCLNAALFVAFKHLRALTQAVAQQEEERQQLWRTIAALESTRSTPPGSK